jgi:hypothetical protein
MKNISFLLMVVAITSLLVAGVTSTTMQAYAYKGKSSHQNGLNVCINSDPCKQSNIGQQASGKNNFQFAFADQDTD